ncbi:MAG: Uma2 family endonuclease [Stenomitos rutilans HA7619-LM2]|jgi:Uma2 family endonuclease|nr:Uma2 family endonuclease [Stenomitos rutilans HA7619-LM2]
MTRSPALNQDIIYPDSDGQPMSDNTRQFNWIVYIKLGCEALFKDDSNVFVAGDLLWYPVEGDNTIRAAPDTMVVFGRPKGDRGSYQQWKEDNIAPQVAFEVLSPGNTLVGMAKKFRFYERYGVEEYYLYDPDKGDFSGWLRSGDFLEVIEEPIGWVSPRLKVRFELVDEALEIYRPDGERFATYLELIEQNQQARRQLEQERERSDKLAAKLKELGINPEDLEEL